MALGFCPAIVAHLRVVAGCATPQTKITPAGFLRMLLVNKPTASILNPDSALALDDGQGHIRDIILKYLKRSVPGQVGNADNCQIDLAQQYSELQLATTQYRKLSIYISDADMSRYCSEATEMVRIAGFPTPFMNEMLTRILAAANGIIGAIDIDLLTLMALEFGVNVTTGTNAPVTVNFPGADAGVNNFYTTGMTKLLQDLSLNEVCGTVNIVGHGNFNAYTIQQMVACCSQLGIDQSRFTGFNFYPDIYSQTIWGTNHIGVFAPDSVGFVELNRYEGWNAGYKGTSWFFTMPLPIDCPECNGAYDSLDFDAQLRYLDCPTLINVGCEGETTVPRGWILDIGKAFGLFATPTDGYQHTAYDDCYNDRLAGNNGSLRYIITNA
jgi:hypothetical protein